MGHPTGPKILVIEDNPSIANMLDVVLVSVGYQVVTALTGRDGLDRVRMESPSVVILDLYLPDMHGGAILKAIRADKATSDTPVIIMTASEKVDDVVRAKAFGANAYITKPFDPRDLVEKVGAYARMRKPEMAQTAKA